MTQEHGSHLTLLEGEVRYKKKTGRGVSEARGGRSMAAISPFEGTRRQAGAIETGSRGKGGKQVRWTR